MTRRGNKAKRDKEETAGVAHPPDHDHHQKKEKGEKHEKEHQQTDEKRAHKHSTHPDVII
jgi:hypothetical protein